MYKYLSASNDQSMPSRQIRRNDLKITKMMCMAPSETGCSYSFSSEKGKRVGIIYLEWGYNRRLSPRTGLFSVCFKYMYVPCAREPHRHGGFNDPSVTRRSGHYENDWAGRIEI